MASLTKTWAANGGGLSKSYSKEYSGTLVQLIDGETIADSVTDQQLTVAIDVSAVKGFLIVSEGGALTVETNNGTTPDDTLVLPAGRPYEWDTDSLDSFLLTADVTDLFLTNASGAAATLYAWAVVDPSP